MLTGRWVETLHWILVVEAPGVDIDVGFGEGLAGGAVGAFLTTLVVGAILVAIFPEYTQRMMTSVTEEPVESLVYGLLALVLLLVASFLLFITIIGIVVAIPLLLLAWVVWGVGAAIAYLAIADRLVGHRDGWLKPLLVAAGINGVLTMTGIGGLIAFAIGAAGFGAVLRSRMS